MLKLYQYQKRSLYLYSLPDLIGVAHVKCWLLIFLNQKKFIEIADKKFVLYEADYPRNRNLVTPTQKFDNDNLKNKYRVSSFPTVIIVDKDGILLGKMKGYNLMRNSTYHFTFIDSVLKKV